MNSGIYLLKNNINGKIYIGLTKNLDTRFSIHRYDHKLKQTLLYRAMRKYGIESFSFEILERCPEEDLCIMEKFYINKYDSTNKSIGYNLTSGGDGGDTFSHRDEESQNKTRIKLKKIGARGICLKVRKGKHVTEVDPSIKDKWEKNFFLSMEKLSERRSSGNFTTAELESYKEMSEKRKGSGNPMFVGMCQVFDEKGDLVGEYPSLREARDLTGIGESSLRKLVLGQLEQIKMGKFKGYTAKRIPKI